MRKSKILAAGLLSLALLASRASQATETVNTNTKTPNNSSISKTITATFSAEQVTELQKIIRNYLVKNPQVLIEASQAYQEQELAKAKTKTQQAIAKNTKSLFSAANSPTVGNVNGDVTVIEFLDYQCAHCKEMSAVLEGLIKSDSKLRVVVKELPIFGGSSKFAAQASLAAMKQGSDKFMSLHKAILETAAPLTNEKILEAAKKSGLNLVQLQTDMKDKTVDDQINANFKLAQELGLLGTPAFIVANRLGTHIEYIPGAVTLDSLQKTISKVRK